MLGAPLALIPLELAHPRVGSSAYRAVVPVASWWIALHLLLAAGFALLALAIYLLPQSGGDRASPGLALILGTFVVVNSAFVGVDGLAVGVLAQRGGSPAEVDALWASPLAGALNAGARLAWVLALVATAARLAPLGRSRELLAGAVTASVAGIGYVWLASNAGLLSYSPAVPVVLLLISIAAGLLAVGLSLPGAGPDRALAQALLMPAAFLPQHGSPAGAAGVAALLLAALVLELRPLSAMP